MGGVKRSSGLRPQKSTAPTMMNYGFASGPSPYASSSSAPHNELRTLLDDLEEETFDQLDRARRKPARRIVATCALCNQESEIDHMVMMRKRHIRTGWKEAIDIRCCRACLCEWEIVAR